MTYLCFTGELMMRSDQGEGEKVVLISLVVSIILKVVCVVYYCYLIIKVDELPE